MEAYMCSLFHSCKYIRQLVLCILDPSKAAPFSCTSCSGLGSIRLPLSLPFCITYRHEPPRFASPGPPPGHPTTQTTHPIRPHHSGGIRSLQRSVGQTLNCLSRLLENGWERLGSRPAPNHFLVILPNVFPMFISAAVTKKDAFLAPFPI